ncbi:QueC [Alteromonas phage vB_AcoS-R7M]|uniref:7-cyano-7-deazaguanine synthase n=1 Tax=Alteromonas phage vB_AcoS-R7M TaxID=2729541 RepID=A0A6M3YNG9_9CAUD|nr:L-glutamine-D-fructose-6-phosphate aminotransferase [Alteromonas phage vB_AcoS-R7M]QJI53370.1 QueC [Alteromonas phage vB_AcoS-R7M]
MCSVFGAIIPIIKDSGHRARLAAQINKLIKSSTERGRDGYGWLLTYRVGNQKEALIHRHAGQFSEWENPILMLPEHVRVFDIKIIGNVRAEPTTEYVMEKMPEDQQPYKCQNWAVVHNGTIANDAELRTNEIPTSIDSAAIPEILAQEELTMKPFKVFEVFKSAIRKLVGSYGIIGSHAGMAQSMFVATNYRPIWYSTDNDCNTFFASSEDYLPSDENVKSLPPYSTAEFDMAGLSSVERLDPYFVNKPRKRALVIASGGLDSTVAASKCINDGMDVKLIHFQYGCRAETHEVEAIEKIAERLNVPFKLFPLNIYDKGSSHLFDSDATIAGGEEGAEYAHEWVPARNLVMLAIATSYAEANGFDYIVLGNNLEEAGAYPDNEPEFIKRMNKVMPYAVGDGKRVEIIMPVGNLMKHEIVALGHTVGAPMDLTWSCYKNGNLHCGKCGPCFMRKTAFKINGKEEVIQYEE